MNVVIFGATGMVGQGVLRECTLDPDVQKILVIGRTASGQQHPKVRELLLSDLSDYSTITNQLSGWDACFFCLGVSSAGMNEEAYRRVTYDITMAAAEALVDASPAMTFIYVSGQGTDSSAQGKVMWARVKGETENALLKMPFKAVFVFRPGMIQPLNGIKSKTSGYRLFYAVTGPFLPLMKWVFPGQITSTEEIGRAMLKVARDGYPKSVLENTDISTL